MGGVVGTDSVNTYGSSCWTTLLERRFPLTAQ